MKLSKEKIFYDQSVQESISLFFQLPIRLLHVVDEDKLFSYCKKINFLDFRYDSKESWFRDISFLIESLPDFIKPQNEKENRLVKLLKKTKVDHIRELYDLIYHTKSSLHPFFYKKIKENQTLWFLSLLHSIYIVLKIKKDESEQVLNFTFLNFTFRARLIQEKILVIGPVILDTIFVNEDNFITYIKNLKYYFGIAPHTYELINLLRHRSRISKELFDLQCDKIGTTYRYTYLITQSDSFSKLQLRQLATFFIHLQQTNRKKIKHIQLENFDTFLKTTRANELLEQIKTNRSKRELESLEWFSDKSFKQVSFSSSLDAFSTAALNYLKLKIQADIYFFVRYYHYNNTFSLLSHPNLKQEYKKQIVSLLDKMNEDPDTLKKSISYQMINDYYQDQKPINLIDDFDKGKHTQIFKNSPKVNSVLSIPLIFDQNIFAIVHFLGFRTFQFDNIDRQFLLKHSSIISQHYIEQIVDSSLTDILELLEDLGVNQKQNRAFTKKIDRICENITKIFACDGVLLWINKKEVYHTKEELDELTLISQFNFLDDDELKEQYTLSSNNNLIPSDIVIVSDIGQIPNDQTDKNYYLKHNKEFLQKKISSFMAIPILNRSNSLSGTLMVFDKTYREYNEFCQNILKRISLHIGSILNTVSTIEYKKQLLDETNLHESFQYLNITNSRIKDLETRLKDVVYPSLWGKHRIYKNIEDIKDYTGYSKHFLHKMIDPSKSIRKYDQILKRDILEIEQNRSYIKVSDSVIQILIAHQERMYSLNKIMYENNLQYKLSVKLPKQQLHDVINNLINNAIKYSKSQTNIKVYDEKTPYYYNVFIKNIGYRIYPDEKDFIFKKGTRGRVIRDELSEDDKYKKRDFENQGTGLYFAKVISGAWRGNVKLEFCKPIGNSGFCENVFSIKFPVDILK